MEGNSQGGGARVENFSAFDLTEKKTIGKNIPSFLVSYI
jgi:hypothetical protein